jgi:hypothetical protein
MKQIHFGAATLWLVRAIIIRLCNWPARKRNSDDAVELGVVHRPRGQGFNEL